MFWVPLRLFKINVFHWGVFFDQGVYLFDIGEDYFTKCGEIFLREKIFLRSKIILLLPICFNVSSFLMFDSKGEKFVDQIKPKYIKYQTNLLKNLRSFNWLIMLVPVQNRKHVDYGVRGRIKFIITHYGDCLHMQEWCSNSKIPHIFEFGILYILPMHMHPLHVKCIFHFVI
jgi:hypothetical protein